MKYHSKPHALSLNKIANEYQNECSLDYFTLKRKTFFRNKDYLKYRFFPVNFNFRGDYKKFRKQSSDKCLDFYNKDIPDITIINMSAHSSPFSFEISKLILSKDKYYIAMLGGQHYSHNERNFEYYQKADHLLVHTVSQKKEMEKLELFKNLDIRVFPLGVDTDKFKYLNKEVKINKNPNLIYVGRIVNWKRIHLAIESINWLIKNSFPESTLKIIGPVSDKKYYKELKKLIKKNSLEKNIFFIGEKKHSELINFYNKADLLLLPSYKETFGMVMIEAMACGTPVAAIISPGGPADTITHNINGILCRLEDYSLSIESFFKDEKLKRKIIKNAVKTVSQKYSIKNTYDVLKKSIDD